jgi:polyhydroxyalkanoate synthesis regulator phasin
LKNYTATLSRTLNWEVTVAANNKEEAKDLIDAMFEKGEITDDNADYGYVELHYIDEVDDEDQGGSE